MLGGTSPTSKSATSSGSGTHDRDSQDTQPHDAELRRGLGSLTVFDPYGQDLTDCGDVLRNLKVELTHLQQQQQQLSGLDAEEPGASTLEKNQALPGFVGSIRQNLAGVVPQLQATTESMEQLLQRNADMQARRGRELAALSSVQRDLKRQLRKFDEWTSTSRMGNEEGEDIQSQPNSTAVEDVMKALSSPEAFEEFCVRATDGTDSDFCKALDSLAYATKVKQAQIAKEQQQSVSKTSKPSELSSLHDNNKRSAAATSTTTQ